MPVRRQTGWIYATAISWRSLAQRFSFVAFLVLSLGLLVLGRSQPVAVEHVRVQIMDGLAPVLDAVSRPMAFAANQMRQIADYLNLKDENERLRLENARLAQWQNAASALENENRELRALLHYKAEPRQASISARVIADTGGPYVRSLVITAGKDDGVREGMAAMSGDGLIGRVVEVGNWSSRILLLTDLNSRIPVMIANGGDHAILAGDNRAQLKLLYLPQDAILATGSRVLTSGHGGVFPPNLPVGIVVGAQHGVYEVAPIAALGRINHVRLIDFNLQGGAFNPMTAKIDADAKLN